MIKQQKESYEKIGKIFYICKEKLGKKYLTEKKIVKLEIIEIHRKT